MPSSINVKGLQVAYGGTSVLKGITMAITPGAVTAIIGPSGCGKTTLLRTLNRLSEMIVGCVVKGKIYLDETDVLKMDPQLLRRRVGMVFQKPNPFPMSIRENVLYGVKATRLKVDHERTVQSCLTKAALWEETKHRLGHSALSLSLGQQQRLCLARSLAVAPAALLLDEPTASLDPSSSAMIEARMTAMKGEFTIVVVTHNMEQAQRVSDFTAFMYGGRLVEFAETSALFGSPQHDLTRRYITGTLS